MKKLFLLAEFTNGHRAAATFAKERGWVEGKDFEFVFCGTHELVIGRLMESDSSYAILPIYNSSVGEITEVTHVLLGLRKRGKVICEKGRLELIVEHCLLVPRYVECMLEIGWVLSHGKAFPQCRVFLEAHDLRTDRHIGCGSTGDAARRLSELGIASARMAAIATEEAAKAYDLKVLHKGIQDDPGNATTFVLLQAG